VWVIYNAINGFVVVKLFISRRALLRGQSCSQNDNPSPALVVSGRHQKTLESITGFSVPQS
jgi:hypothetical protein